MSSTYVAVDAASDRLGWARLLRRAHRRVVAGGTVPDGILRSVIVDSWARCGAAAVDPASKPPYAMDEEEVRDRLRGHCFAPMLPIVETVLGAVAHHARQLVVLADADGMVLWTGGGTEAEEVAARIRLLPGTLWTEATAGTNALGTALVLDQPVQVFSAEHYLEALHGVSSAAAPIHDPDTGAVLGLVGLTGPFRAAHPHGLSLVVAAAQMTEAQLEHRAAQRDGQLKVAYLQRVIDGCTKVSAVVNAHGKVLLATPPGWLSSSIPVRDGVPVPPGPEAYQLEPLCDGTGYLVLRAPSPRRGMPPLRIEALGRERVRGSLEGRPFELTKRHSEILVVLAMHPDGLSESALGAALYGSQTKRVTIRAELSRLRKLLGPVVTTPPYRLLADVRADFLEVERLLTCGKSAPAVQLDHGPLLPGSSAPAVVAARERLVAAAAAAETGGDAERGAQVLSLRRAAPSPRILRRPGPHGG